MQIFGGAVSFTQGMNERWASLFSTEIQGCELNYKPFK